MPIIRQAALPTRRRPPPPRPMRPPTPRRRRRRLRATWCPSTPTPITPTIPATTGIRAITPTPIRRSASGSAAASAYDGRNARWRRRAAALFERRAGALDARAGVAQRFGRGGVGDAEMGRQTEGHALHHRDALGIEQILDEIGVGFDRLALGRALAERAGAGGIDIERALRPRALDALGAVEHADHEIAALLEGGVVPGDEILGPVERLDRGGLADRARVRGRLRLQGRHRPDELDRPAGKADAPAGHAIGLGDAVERQRPRIELGLDLRDGGEFEPV